MAQHGFQRSILTNNIDGAGAVIHLTRRARADGFAAAALCVMLSRMLRVSLQMLGIYFLAIPIGHAQVCSWAMEVSIFDGQDSLKIIEISAPRTTENFVFEYFLLTAEHDGKPRMAVPLEYQISDDRVRSHAYISELELSQAKYAIASSYINNDSGANCRIYKAISNAT